MLYRKGLLCVVVAGITLSGCSSKEAADIAQLKKDQDAMKQSETALSSENAQLKAQLAAATAKNQASATPATQTTSNTATATTNATSASTTAASTATSAPFSDIAGVFGEKEITDLARWHVFDPLSGTFEPHKLITRAEFARWLVKAQNSYHTKAKSTNKIRLAETSQPTFPDVPAYNPDFPYIQSLTDAGYAVGFDDKTFKPDANLTREQMIGMKVGVDLGRDPQPVTFDYVKQSHGGFSDLNKVSKRFWGAFYQDTSNWTRCDNIGRLCGSTKLFKPQSPVTRAEAAVVLWKMGCYDTAVASADIAQ